MNLKKVSKMPNLMLGFIEIIFFYIIAVFYKGKYNKNLWLICERGNEAKDNGYQFFKYINENNKAQEIYYLIDRDFKVDYERVKKVGNVIQFNSFDHKLAFILSSTVISTHLGKVCPWNYRLFKLFFDRRNKKKFVFLQHGITKDNVKDILGPHSKIDLFICGAKPEYEYIKTEFGYRNNQVVYTGFARFDTLKSIDDKKQILIMPTWRQDIDSLKNKDLFLNTEYYKKYQSILNNKKLINYIENNNYKLIFYPHYEIQKYLKCFKTNSPNIILANKDSFDVQILLRESRLLVTDFSSVFFDFAYMNKPIIYYQFDEDRFFKSHYKKGYFDYRRDGFGPVFKEEIFVVEKIIQYIESGFQVEYEYRDKVNVFFELKDTNNCERIYNAINRYI